MNTKSTSAVFINATYSEIWSTLSLLCDEEIINSYIELTTQARKMEVTGNNVSFTSQNIFHNTARKIDKTCNVLLDYMNHRGIQL